MAFASYFPATAWVWRRLTSRWVRRLFLSLFVTLLLLSAGLRTWAFTFEYRVNSIVAGLAQLHLDQTTKSEMLARVPALHPDSREVKNCAADECYSARISNWMDGTIYWLFMKLSNQHTSAYTYKLMYWLGLRYWDFDCKVRLRQGMVFRLNYNLALDNGTGEVPDILYVRVGSERGYHKNGLSPIEDESPEYRVSTNRKWPLLGLQVQFTPGALPQHVHHAFEVHLNCIWQLHGCQTAPQILPTAWRDKQIIEDAARARLLGPNPCPDRILVGRARDVADIALVEVYRVHEEIETYGYQSYIMADYRLVEVFKGKLDRPLKGVGHPPLIYTGSSDLTAPNPALRLLRPGNRVLMFSDNSSNIDAPCEIVAATPSALRTIREALASHVADEAPPE